MVQSMKFDDALLTDVLGEIMTAPPDTMTGPPAYPPGGLRQALIETAVQLVEELGPEQLTVREAARRAGVSSGAPFRHFANRTALMTAVAEEGMLKLAAAIAARRAAVAPVDPLVELSAFADGYFAWAVENPTHYRVLADRALIDFPGSAVLSGGAAAFRTEIAGLLAAAMAQHLLRPCDLEVVHLQARALSYGLARMCVDDHLREWTIGPDQELGAMRRVMDDFLASLAREPERARTAIAAARRIEPFDNGTIDST